MGFLKRLGRPSNFAAFCAVLLLLVIYKTASNDGREISRSLSLEVPGGGKDVERLGSDVVSGKAETSKLISTVNMETEAAMQLSKTASPPDMRITILTFLTYETSYTYLSLKNHHDYANKHNYSLVVDYDAPSPQGLMWHKFDMLERTIAAGTADWMWWIDFDTLITNSTIKLADIVSEALAEVGKEQADGVDLIISKDCGPINAGSMLLRASPSSLRFLARVRKYGLAHPKLSEQDCIRDVIAASKNGEKNSTLFIPQRRINSYPSEITCYDDEEMSWRRGDFVIHFAGAWAYLHDDEDSTGTLMRRYAGGVV